VNVGYSPGGGDKKIDQRKLSWEARSKIGSLERASYQPGGGMVKIENRKLEWNTQSKVGSVNNIKHKPGGGNVKIYNNKQEFQVGSRIGSLANVKHRPGGGDKKIFDDREYLKMTAKPSDMSRSSSGSLTEPIYMSKSYSATKNLVSESSSPHYLSQLSRKLSPMGKGLQ